MTIKFSILAALCVLLAASFQTFAASGDLDLSFGGGLGYVTTTVAGHPTSPTSMAIQSDGKILVAAVTKNTKLGSAFSVTRFNTDGSLDTTFSEDGSQVLDFPNSNAILAAVASERGGGVLLAGSSDDGSVDLALLLSNGSLDQRFGRNGVLVIKPANTYLWAGSVAIQSDGKIVIGGTYFDLSAQRQSAMIIRCLSTGLPDTSFGRGGILLETGYLEVDSISTQPAGKIVVSGKNRQGGLFVLRINLNSSRDSTFGTNGIVSPQYPGLVLSNSFSRMSVTANGNVFLTSLADRGGQHLEVFLTQFNFDGSLDLGFGNGGTVFRPEMNDLASFALDHTGKVLLPGGGDHTYIDPSGNSFLLEDIVLCRLDSAGNADTAFGTLGFVHTFLQQNSYDYPIGVAVQADGKIVVAAGIETATSGSIAVFRYLP